MSGSYDSQYQLTRHDADRTRSASMLAMADHYELLDVTVDGGVAVVEINAPPINVMTIPLYIQLATCVTALEADDDVKVVVFRSADPDFFIAHFDVEAILQFPTDGEPTRDENISAFHEMCERVRTMPKATICEIAGRVGGGGSELASSCDMRFGALGKTIVNQMEVPLGILPGGTGTQRLPRLVGRGRAMEIILGGIDLDAETAERWGYLNRALPPAELRPFVDALARRIAGFPAGAIARAKRAVANADDLPLREGLIEEAFLFQETLRDPEAQAAMRRFLEIGGQTREVEMRVAEAVDGMMHG
jgi:enoyl-CoA hydratase/carnithine racemase